MGYERYRFIVQVVLGEQKGGGVKSVLCYFITYDCKLNFD